MLQRILELPDETLDALRHLGRARRRRSSGSALPRLISRALDGPASARTSTTSTARPRSPGRRSPRPRTCATRRARPAAAARHRGGLYDEDGRRSTSRARPAASSSATTLQFEGYTGGGGKDVIDGLLSSGDVGHFDAAGRLFIDGRDDDMIVSGGENVFPAEVEDLLAAPRGDLGGRGLRRRRREVRPAAEGRGRAARRRASCARTRSRRTSRPTSPATRSRATSCSSTSCRAPRPARSSSASSKTTESPRYNGWYGPANRSLLARPARAQLGRGTPARPARHARALRAGRRELRRRSRRPSPCASTSRARPATATRSGCASAPSLEGPCMRCLEPGRAGVRRRRPRGAPARRRRRAAVRRTSTRTTSSTCAPGCATPSCSRCPARSPAARTARACARPAAQPQRRSGPRARGRAGPALGEALRAPVRMALPGGEPLPFPPPWPSPSRSNRMRAPPSAARSTRSPRRR